MTCLKPLSNLRVLAAFSERYPGNKTCSMPDCTDPVSDFHHCFPRSLIAGDSWFVIIANEDTGAYDTDPIPHVTGLCRAHHNDVEEHRAWIKLEDGEFVWYDRSTSAEIEAEPDGSGYEPAQDRWDALGPLNPQPGSVEGKPKKRKKPKQPARKKAVYSIRVPADMAEDGHEILETLIDANRERLSTAMGWSESVPDYFVISAVLAEGLQ